MQGIDDEWITGAAIEQEAGGPVIRGADEVAVAEQRRETFVEGDGRHVEGGGRRQARARRGGEQGRQEPRHG